MTPKEVPEKKKEFLQQILKNRNITKCTEFFRRILDIEGLRPIF